jgi:hypothetical protein
MGIVCRWFRRLHSKLMIYARIMDTYGTFDDVNGHTYVPKSAVVQPIPHSSMPLTAGQFQETVRRRRQGET